MAHIVTLVLALAFSGSRSGQWIVQACPANPLIRIPCRSIIEPNYGQAVKEARILATSGWRVQIREI